ncbi:MAG: CopL family metal-binding regulatory protein, partial [Pseudomonas sp.]
RWHRHRARLPRAGGRIDDQAQAQQQAGAMAMPPPAPAARTGCHDAAMTGMAASGNHAGMPMPDHGTGPKHGACCKAGSCDCLQHCNATLALPTPVQLPAVGGEAPSWTLRDRRGEPAPYRPIRPPIA